MESCITITPARSSRWSAQQNGRPGKLKKHFRVDSESVTSALKLCFLFQAVLAMPALAQTPSEQNSPLPSQAKQVHGLESLNRDRIASGDPDLLEAGEELRLP